jgi:hypothetical protein
MGTESGIAISPQPLAGSKPGIQTVKNRLGAVRVFHDNNG